MILHSLNIHSQMIGQICDLAHPGVAKWQQYERPMPNSWKVECVSDISTSGKSGGACMYDILEKWITLYLRCIFEEIKPK